MTFMKGMQSIRKADDELHPVEELEYDEDDVYDDENDDTTTTAPPRSDNTTLAVEKHDSSTKPKIGI